MQTPAALLDAVIKVLTQQKGEVLTSTWFDGAESVALKDGRLVIYVKSDLTRETLGKPVYPKCFRYSFRADRRTYSAHLYQRPKQPF